jgi:RND family efflux transporter MFP subunit
MKAIDKMNKGPWLWLGLGVGLVLAAGGVLVATGVVKLPGMNAQAQATAQAGKDGKGEKDEKGEKAPVPLEFAAREVVQPSLATLATTIEFSGPLVAPQTAMVRAKAGGTLLALNVAEGSRVQAGQLLGRIEMAEMGSRLAERSALIESARASLAQAERTHANNERLAQQQFISPTALETSRSALEGARAQLAAAQAALDTTRAGLRDATLTAPIGGIVAKRHVLPGEKVSPEQQVLTLVDLARLELAGTVGTHEVARLAAGMPVQVQVEGVDKGVTGRIARIAPAAEPGTRAIGVTIALDNPKETLRAGQYALARAVLNDGTERLTLPVTAVGNNSGQDHVWVIDGGVLARRAVLLGRRDAESGRVEVLQGLKPESQVLAARFDNLREGTKASVVAGKAAAVASASASTPAN